MSIVIGLERNTRKEYFILDVLSAVTYRTKMTLDEILDRLPDDNLEVPEDFCKKLAEAVAKLS